MDIKKIEDREFINKIDGRININFSTALNNINYKKEESDGIENIKKIRDIFNIKKVCYLNQTHSDIVIDITNSEAYGKRDGDGIIVKDINVGIGVFTADCVPVLIYDKEKLVVAAVHSGWKGTFNEIVKKACITMKEKYKCENINIVIGPHIKRCCYQVSDELQKKFVDKFGVEVSENRMLNLERCIEKQVKEFDYVKNIENVNICTYCEENLELHSYRKNKEDAGRLFSFIYIK